MVLPLHGSADDIVKLRLEFGDTVTCLAISDEDESGVFFAAGGINKRVKLYDMQTGVERKTYVTSSQVACIALPRLNGRLKVVVGTFNGKVLGFDAALDLKLPMPAEIERLCHSGQPLAAMALSATASGVELLAVGGQVHEVMLYKLHTDSRLNTHLLLLEQLDRIPFPSFVRGLAMDVLGRRLAIAGDARIVKLWELGDKSPDEEQREERVGYGGMRGSAVPRDHREERRSCPVAAEAISDQSEAAGAGAASTASGKEDDRELSPELSKLKRNLKLPPLARMMWRAMEQEGITDGEIERKLLHTFQTKSAAHAVAFSPAGDKLAIGTAEHQTTVWELTLDESGLQTEPLLELGQAVREGGLCFSKDGSRLAIGSGELVQVTRAVKLASCLATSWLPS